MEYILRQLWMNALVLPCAFFVRCPVAGDDCNQAWHNWELIRPIMSPSAASLKGMVRPTIEQLLERPVCRLSPEAQGRGSLRTALRRVCAMLLSQVRLAWHYKYWQRQTAGSSFPKVFLQNSLPFYLRGDDFLHFDAITVSWFSWFSFGTIS